MSETPFNQITFGEASPGQRLLLLLVLDTSSSMQTGGRIEALNKGISDLREYLNEDDVARITAEIAVLTFDSEVRLEQDFALPPAFSPPRLTAQGQTFMGRALIEAMDTIEQRKKYLRENGNPLLRPIMLILTDGYPEGEPPGVLEDAKAKIRDYQAKRRARVWPICIGDGIDPRQLADVTGTDAMRLNEAKWHELFVWVSDGIKSASRSTDEKAALPLAPPTWGAS
jgi:uncharacterized protein YegL